MGWFGPSGDCGCCSPPTCCTDSPAWDVTVEGTSYGTPTWNVNLGTLTQDAPCEWSGEWEICDDGSTRSVLGVLLIYDSDTEFWQATTSLWVYNFEDTLLYQSNFSWVQIASGQLTCIGTTWVLENGASVASGCFNSVTKLTIEGVEV